MGSKDGITRAKLEHLSGPALFTVVSAVGPLIGLITGTLTARWLTPAEFGAIQTALLLSPYLVFLGFGIYHGLNRDYPYLMGKGQPHRALDMVGASAMATKWVTAVTMAVAGAYALVVTLKSGDRLLAIAVWAAIPIVSVYPLSTHYEVLFRTRDDFRKFAWIQAIGYLLSVVTLALVYLWQFYGQCLRLISNSLFNLLLRWRWRPLRDRQSGNWHDAKILAHVGFPLLIANYLQGIFVVADRSVVAINLGTEAVGYYALTGIVLASMGAFPMALAQVVLPRASASYGATNHPRNLRRWVWILVGIGLAVLIPFALLGWWLIPVLITSLLPKYTPGIPSAQVGLIAGAISIPGISSIFLVLRRNTVYIATLAVSTFLIWILSTVVLNAGGDLVSVSWVRVAATGVLSSVSLAYAIYLTK